MLEGGNDLLFTMHIDVNRLRIEYVHKRRCKPTDALFFFEPANAQWIFKHWR